MDASNNGTGAPVMVSAITNKGHHNTALAFKHRGLVYVGSS